MRRTLVCAAFLMAAPLAAAEEAIPETTLKKLKAATAFVRVSFAGGRGNGSGFLIQRRGRDGYLVTNAHVVRPRGRPAHSITAVFNGGSEGEYSVPAQVVGLDQDRDLAILKMTSDKLPPPLELRSTLRVRETLPVHILGYPFGRALTARRGNPEITIARGSISSIRKDNFGRAKYYQIDGDLNPGNSGGPIVDKQGALVGVAVAKLMGTQIGMAIPPRELSEMLMGRVQGVDFSEKGNSRGTVKYEVRARLIDPLGQMQSVAVLIFPRSQILNRAKPDKEGRWSAFTPSMVFPLKVQGGEARGGATVRGDVKKDVPYLMQVRYERADGKVVYTEPGDLMVRFTAGADASATPGPVPGPGPTSVRPPAVPAGDLRMTLGPMAEKARKIAAGAPEPGSEGLSARLPDQVAHAALAMGGAYLVLRFKVHNKLGVFNIAHAKIEKEIPLPEADVVVAAGGKHAVFYAPSKKYFEKWDLEAGRQVTRTFSRVPGKVTHMAMGLAEEREALISYAAGTEALDRRGYAMLNLSNFSYRDAKAGFRNHCTRDRIQIRVNAGLTAATMWATSHSPTGFIYGRRSGAGAAWKVTYEHSSFGALTPSDDGKLVFSSTGGVYSPQGKRLANYYGSLVTPVYGTNMFMQIEKDRTVHLRGPDMKDKVRFFKAPESAAPRRWERQGMASDLRAIASGPISRVVFIDNNATRIRVMDLGLEVSGGKIAIKSSFSLEPAGPAVPEGPRLSAAELFARARKIAAGAEGPGAEGRSLRLPDQVSDVKMAYGGAYLILRYKVLNKLGVFNIAHARMDRTIPTPEADVVCAAGGRHLVFYCPSRKSFEKWDLETVKLIRRAPSQVDGQVTHVAMGLTEGREALISYVQGSGALDPRRYAVLKLSDFSYKNTKARFHNSSKRDFIHMRANSKLTAVTMWATSHSPTGFILGRRGGVGQPWKVIYEHSSFGALSPTDDGLSVLSSSGGVYGLQARPIRKFSGSQLFPVYGANYFLQVESDGTAHLRDLDFKERAAAFKLPEGFSGRKRWARGAMSSDLRLMASGPVNRVAFIDNNGLRIHVLSLGLKK